MVIVMEYWKESGKGSSKHEYFRFHFKQQDFQDNNSRNLGTICSNVSSQFLQCFKEYFQFMHSTVILYITCFSMILQF